MTLFLLFGVVLRGAYDFAVVFLEHVLDTGMGVGQESQKDGSDDENMNDMGGGMGIIGAAHEFGYKIPETILIGQLFHIDGLTPI